MPEADPIVCDGPIHEFFGLSYASYLVLPRTFLQSMPPDWQSRLIDLLNEAEGRLGSYPEEGVYQVYLVDDKGHRIHDPLEEYARGRRRITPLSR